MLKKTLISLSLAAVFANGFTMAAGTVPNILADHNALANTQTVYNFLVQLENCARDPRCNHKTLIGEHEELQQEVYNAANYGDQAALMKANNTSYNPGYYYNKSYCLSKKLPAFLELDMGPGWYQSDWGAFQPRSYDQTWQSGIYNWKYVDYALDLAMNIWKGYPRASDYSYNYNQQADPKFYCKSSSCAEPQFDYPANGGSAAGLVGFSFHEPYPGAPQKSFENTLLKNLPANYSHNAKDNDFLAKVVDDHDNTPEYRAWQRDLSYLADQLSYLNRFNVPVLFRPYHEMNKISSNPFWWAGNPEDYKKLWRLTYQYLVNQRGLHNLIFVWAPLAWVNSYTKNPSDYYPGSQYVDIVAVDDYVTWPSPQHFYKKLETYNKPRMMAETYHVPIAANSRDQLSTSPWVIWSVWGEGLTNTNYNSAQDVDDTYNSAEVYTGGAYASQYTPNFDWRSLH
ncbi:MULTISPECIES: glycoside hydrolase family 26 protein [Cysteiniphilum]|uniref:glycoside hydrolase family 26 protein n=1 Tax=Cysteiniphilum TaxID=2056696 RepID=UPI00177FD0DC|nr:MULTISPECIES: glycosyl hydrolase [Cysteiniphilum]